MNGGRRMFEPLAGVEKTSRPPRRNRLSRSFRQSQAVPAKDLDSPRSPREAFPTRSCRQSQTGLVEVPESTRSQREPGLSRQVLFGSRFNGSVQGCPPDYIQKSVDFRFSSNFSTDELLLF
ncbi:hypothetical protein CHARACLAT_031761 [Characodon lateralis]|uniref:Uncharacterized protein n=1 Tax=Characodon lateralis TaxID=208331 RepID=A0ABU7DFW6_9TELE|nr:hypothetical protein [Characodon lateralis]